MILKYGGSNYFCFKEDFEVDLRLNKNCPEDISCGKDYSQVICIKGANASGKTNTLKALSFISSFITSSFDKKPESKLDIETYFGNDQPSFLFCEFRIDNLDYRYELELKDSAVVFEKLILLSSPSPILAYRVENKIESVETSYSELSSIPQLRSNASIISIAHQHELECIRDIYNLFYFMRTNVGYTGFNELTTDEGTSKFYFETPQCLEFVIKQLKKFDTGVVDIVIDFYENNDGEKVYFPLFCFDINGKMEKLRLHSQSSGTRRLYKLLANFFVVIYRNDTFPFASLFILDELDLHLHSLIIPELIHLIENEDNTQLIFTCQNDQVLDNMGKYRTILINKNDNESYSYRLDELPSDLLRNGRPITPHYRKGSIGGVPNIGE